MCSSERHCQLAGKSRVRKSDFHRCLIRPATRLPCHFAPDGLKGGTFFAWLTLEHFPHFFNCQPLKEGYKWRLIYVKRSFIMVTFLVGAQPRVEGKFFYCNLRRIKIS